MKNRAKNVYKCIGSVTSAIQTWEVLSYQFGVGANASLGTVYAM